MTVLGTTWHKFIKHRYVYRETLPRRFLSSFLSLKKRERKETVKISSKRTRVGEKKTERNVSVTRKNRCFFLFFFLYLTLWTKIVNLVLGLVTIRASRIFREGSGRIFSLPRKILYFRKSEKLLKRSFGKRTG